jgi:virginiamycin B lyase
MNQIIGRCLTTVCLAVATGLSFAGGSNYGVVPGTRDLSGRVSEWPVPTPEFARDPAVGADGNIYITEKRADKIARFDPRTATFTEWNMPPGTRPHGLVVDHGGIVWYSGNGNGTIGELDPRTGNIVHHPLPSGGDPHTLVFDAQGNLWFSVYAGNRIGRLDHQTRKVTEYRVTGGPYGIAVDLDGKVWYCAMDGDKIGQLDPQIGNVVEIGTGKASAPRRMAIAPDGLLWVTLGGKGTLLKIDPKMRRILTELALPAGPGGGPYAVTADGAGRIWVNEIESDSVVLVDPRTQEMRVFNLPTKNEGVRKMVVDAQGRLWYMGSHSGRLGMIQ